MPVVIILPVTTAIPSYLNFGQLYWVFNQTCICCLIHNFQHLSGRGSLVILETAWRRDQWGFKGQLRQNLNYWGTFLENHLMPTCLTFLLNPNLLNISKQWGVIEDKELLQDLSWHCHHYHWHYHHSSLIMSWFPTSPSVIVLILIFNTTTVYVIKPPIKYPKQINSIVTLIKVYKIKLLPFNTIS